MFGWHSLYAVFHRDAMVIIALAFLRDQPAVVELINRFSGKYSITFFCTFLIKLFQNFALRLMLQPFDSVHS